VDDDTPPPAGPVSDRMQALLSRAVDEQVHEQRAVSTVLDELRGHVAGLVSSVSAVPSASDVARLEGVVSAVVSDLRTATTLLGQRLDVLAERVDQTGKDSAAPTADTTARLSELAALLAAQADAVRGLRSSMEAMSVFPASLAAVQKEVAGLHDRLAPLADLRAGVDDLGARTTTTWDSLAPTLAELEAKVAALGGAPDPQRLRDGVVEALTDRLDRIQATASGAAGITPDQLAAAMANVPTALETAVAAVSERLGAVAPSLAGLETRLGEVAERLSDVGDVAGGVPALATELHRVREQVESLTGLQDQLAAVGSGVQHLQDDPASRTIALGLAGLREDVDGLTERVAGTASPTADEVAAVVSERVTDRLVEMLAPRVAELVLSRVGDALVSQLTGVLSAQVRRDTAEVVQVTTADSERRVVAHVDDAVLALAEALLRRRRAGRPPSVVLPPADVPPEQLQASADSHDVAVLADHDVADVEGLDDGDGGNADNMVDVEDPAGADTDAGVLDVDEDGQPVEAVTAASERPAVPREPVREPTPDFDEDVAEPVAGVPGPRLVPQVPSQPALPAGKRRPWWRPGG